MRVKNTQRFAAFVGDLQGNFWIGFQGQAREVRLMVVFTNGESVDRIIYANVQPLQRRLKDPHP